MSDTLKVFGKTYTGVAGFKAKSGETLLPYIRPQGSVNVTENGTVDVTNKASAVVNVQPDLQAKAATPSETQKMITADEVYWKEIARFSDVSLTPDVEYPFGNTLEVGKEYEIFGEGGDEFEATFVFTGSPQSIVTDRGYTGTIRSTGIIMSAGTDFADMVINTKVAPYGLSSVRVNAIPSNYVGSAITRNPTPTVSGKTVTIPPGYYSAQKTQDVAEATQATPSISVDANGLITASATQTTGYVAAGTKSATHQLSTQGAVTITPTKASQQAVASGKYTTGAVTIDPIPAEYIIPSGSATITENGTVDVTDKASAVVNVQPDLQSKTVTPTKSQQTITPDGTKDGLSSVIVNAIPAEYITTADANAAAGDIVSGQTAYVNGSKVTGTLVIQHYYTGSSAPSSSLGEDGDIYLQG